MATAAKFSATALKQFERDFDEGYEDRALVARSTFIRDFPIAALPAMKIDDYVIGHGTPTFCFQAEVSTRPWASIQGATARKFGIYYGRTKSDATRKYRYLKGYASQQQAFDATRRLLVDLVREGAKAVPDFAAIDANGLSPMFKAKILSLYFPHRFINVCSPEHLKKLAGLLGLPAKRPLSEYQHELLQLKNAQALTRGWSNPKFMSFLYGQYMRSAAPPPIRGPRKKTFPEVNFEDIQDARNRIGKLAEDFALHWEKQRLRDAGFESLVRKIKDRRKRPAYGYDFLSHSAPGRGRYIEVKAVGKVRGDTAYRFFLSGNEKSVSESAQHGDHYFFYLVRFGGDGLPVEVIPMLARSVYAAAQLSPASYTVRFRFD